MLQVIPILGCTSTERVLQTWYQTRSSIDKCNILCSEAHLRKTWQKCVPQHLCAGREDGVLWCMSYWVKFLAQCMLQEQLWLCILTASCEFSYSKRFFVQCGKMSRVWASCGCTSKLQNIIGTHQQSSDFIMIGHKAAMNAGVKAFPSMSWMWMPAAAENASKNSTKRWYGLKWQFYLLPSAMSLAILSALSWTSLMSPTM